MLLRQYLFKRYNCVPYLSLTGVHYNNKAVNISISNVHNSTVWKGSALCDKVTAFVPLSLWVCERNKLALSVGRVFNKYKWFDKWATTYSLSGQAKKQLPAWEKFQQSRRVWKPLPDTEKTLYECPWHFIQKQTFLFWNRNESSKDIQTGNETKPLHMLNKSVVIFCRSPEWVESWEQHANEQTKSEYLSRCASDSKMLKMHSEQESLKLKI